MKSQPRPKPRSWPGQADPNDEDEDESEDGGILDDIPGVQEKPRQSRRSRKGKSAKAPSNT